MPVKPEPIKLTCKLCGESMILIPRGDCFTMPNCKQCGEREWKRSKLTLLDQFNPQVVLHRLQK